MPDENLLHCSLSMESTFFQFGMVFNQFHCAFHYDFVLYSTLNAHPFQSNFSLFVKFCESSIACHYENPSVSINFKLLIFFFENFQESCIFYHGLLSHIPINLLMIASFMGSLSVCLIGTGLVLIGHYIKTCPFCSMIAQSYTINNKHLKLIQNFRLNNLCRGRM